MQEQRIYSAIACNLRQFGYRDVTAEIVAGVHEAMKRSDAPAPAPEGGLRNAAQA